MKTRIELVGLGVLFFFVVFVIQLAPINLAGIPRHQLFAQSWDSDDDMAEESVETDDQSAWQDEYESDTASDFEMPQDSDDENNEYLEEESAEDNDF